MKASEGALEGVTVFDLTSGVAGPYCTRLLAGLGAEVIKIEEPPQGDVSRSVTPISPGQPTLEQSALFHHLNCGKQSVAISLKTAEGRRLFGGLARQAQVVVEDFAPGTLDAMGLGYSSLSGENTALVMTSIAPFGQDGPYRDMRATNLTCLAMGGMLYTCGEPGREPLKVGGLQAEYLAGLNAAAATLVAVLVAEARGTGQWIDVSIVESVVTALEATAVTFSRDREVRRRQGNRHGRAHPMTILACRDGYVGVMVACDEDWELLARLAGVNELLAPRFAKGEQRLRLAEEIDALLRSFLVERTREELFHRAQELRLPFSIVLTPQEALDDPQHEARGFFTNVEHPAAGEVLQVGAPFKMSETPWRAGRAPMLGEHTENVLRERL